MTRRRLAAAAAVTAVVAVGAAAVTIGAGGGGEPERAAPATTTAVVERRTLAETLDLDGRLGFANPRPLIGRRPGTLTWLPAARALLRSGEVAWRVDDQPVVLLYGGRPAWRPMAAGTEGKDVLALEQNLRALGHDPTGRMTVDEEFTDATAAALERLQEAAGMREDGVADLGEIVFAPGPCRVTEAAAVVGAPAPVDQPVLETSGEERVVRVDLATTRRGLVRVGQAVTVELPTGRRVAGRVSRIGAVVAAPEEGTGGEPTLDMLVSLGGRPVRAFDGAPVVVRVERVVAEDVLAVPVPALLALAGGGYGLEVVGGAATRLVAVEVGAVAGGWAEVTAAELSEGTRVAVAA